MSLDLASGTPVLSSRGLGHVGAWRSPVDSSDAAGHLAEAIDARGGFDLVGLMAHESQVAGLVDDAPGRRIRSRIVRCAKRASLPEVAERRAASAARVGAVAEPRADVATVLGGDWIASGMPGTDRSPQPVWPAGIRLTRDEGAGEVQTPLVGRGARALGTGDRVWLRHTKAGELSEGRAFL